MAMFGTVLSAVLLATSSSAAVVDDESAQAALVSDNCPSGFKAEECALNLLQFHGITSSEAVGTTVKGQVLSKTAGAFTAHGLFDPNRSCQNHCFKGFEKGRGCQCNDQCRNYNNCCPDKDEVCRLHHATRDSAVQHDDLPSPEPPAAAPKELPAAAPEEPPATAPKKPYAATSKSPKTPVNPPPSNPNQKVYGNHIEEQMNIPYYPGFTLMFFEDFERGIDLDNDPWWTWSDGGLKEGLVRFVKEGLSFENGKMIITVDNMTEAIRSKIEPCSSAEGKYLPQFPLYSGELRTKFNYFRYGRYEFRMKAPAIKPGDYLTNGNFIATGFWYHASKQRFWQEIDFEITGEKNSRVTTNVLTAKDTDEWRNGIQSTIDLEAPAIDGTNTPGNCRSDFHDYAIEFLPTGITWYVDGEKVRHFTGDHHGGANVNIPTKSGKFIFNLWIFGGTGFGGIYPGNNTYPMRSEYEWVRFYKYNGDDLYPCENMDDSCLTNDDGRNDLYLTKNNPCDGIDNTGKMLNGSEACSNVCRH